MDERVHKLENKCGNGACTHFEAANPRASIETLSESATMLFQSIIIFWKIIPSKWLIIENKKLLLAILSV